MPQPTIIREFVGLPSVNAPRAGAGGHPCQGLYHRPADRRPKIAVIASHYHIEFSEHYLAEYLAARGIGFLGWNTRFRGYESSFVLDLALTDIGVGVRWLNEVAGVDTVVLLGNPPFSQANRSARGIAAACTLRNWLGMWSLQTAQTRAEPHLARITCPAMDADHYFTTPGTRDEQADVFADWINARW